MKEREMDQTVFVVMHKKNPTCPRKLAWLTVDDEGEVQTVHSMRSAADKSAAKLGLEVERGRAWPGDVVDDNPKTITTPAATPNHPNG